MVPKAVRVAVLVNPANVSNTETTVHVVQEAAGAKIDAVFASFARERPDALFVHPNGFFVSRAVQFATLAARDKIPAAYPVRDMTAVGGLMSYGTDTTEMFRQVGVYAGSILKGAKPADIAKRSRRLQVDDQYKFGRLQHRPWH